MRKHSSNWPSGNKYCSYDKIPGNFPAQIRKFLAQGWNLFQEANNVFVKVFLWTGEKHFWRFCPKVSPKFEKFSLKMHLWRLLKYFRREFNNFCLRNQTKLKNQHVFDKNSQKILGTLEMQFQQKRRNFFSKLK